MGYPLPTANSAIPLTFTLVLSSDHVTGATGKSPTVTLSKNGGAFAAAVGAVTEIGGGNYQVAANTIDANTLGPLLLHATASACDPSDETFIVVNYNPTAFTPTNTALGPGAVSVISIINTAYKIIGVKGRGYNLNGEEVADGLNTANEILSMWSVMPLTIPAIGREVFALTGGRGGPSDPYTIGPSGDFDTTRPTSITNVGLLVTSSAQPFEIQRAQYTDDAYASITQKELQSTYFAGMYLNMTYASGLATINLYPVPSDDTTSLVLYRPMQLSRFATPASTYDFPPAAVTALTYELARRLAVLYARPWSGELQRDCDQYLSIYQRSNTKMSDLALDAALTTQAGIWNILTDGMSGGIGR
jgi:hypothetical protein